MELYFKYILFHFILFWPRQLQKKTSNFKFLMNFTKLEYQEALFIETKLDLLKFSRSPNSYFPKKFFFLHSPRISINLRQQTLREFE